MKLYLLLVVWRGLVDSACQTERNPVVTVTRGQLKGTVMRSRLGRNIYSFRGIPYAKPPVGSRRFQPPEAPDSWEGTLDATADGYSCLQPSTEYPFPTSENCLYLNVYTPQSPATVSNAALPVVVYFHSGGFYSASGHSGFCGPQYLLDKDIVLVVNNWRLGALGFLSTGDAVLPGNYGLKDQVAALRWVKENIAAFGGNPELVTIMGYSAGSHSVLLHMVSPMSADLFHRAIAMSGPALRRSAIIRDQLSLARRQAALLNCPTNTSQEIHNCMMQQDAQRIASSLRGLTDWSTSPVLRFSPAIEAAGVKSERFLVGEPVELFLSGKFHDVPLLIGRNRDEFAYFAVGILRNQTLTNDMNARWDFVAPITFMYDRNSNASLVISSEIKKFYFNNMPVSNQTREVLEKLYIDSITGYGMDRSAKVVSCVISSPVYFYNFVYQGRYSFQYKAGTVEPYGVVHHDDLLYLFYNSQSFPFFTPKDPETEIVERITTMWVNFMQRGDPSPNDNHTWHPFTPMNLWYMEIGDSLTMKKGLDQERVTLWERLIPLPVVHSQPKEECSRY